MNALSRLLERPREFDSAVARKWDSASDVESLKCWGDLVADVAGLNQRLQDEPGGAWVLLTEDAYAFAVGMLALWHSGRHAISPPNRQPESLRNLQTRAGGVLCDRPDWISEGSSVHPLWDAAPNADPTQLRPLDPNAPAVELYTSGTTGGEKPVMKRICHLEDEVAEVESLWGKGVSGSVVFTTSSHQHLYGMLFGVLWPLALGHVFHSHHFLHAGEAVPRMLAARRCALVSVPTHLKRFVRHTATAELRGVCPIVFSSGGPLPEETAHDLERMLDCAPFELLGATETGGIAWRSQKIGTDDGLWTPFPSVDVSSDAETTSMRVRSPFVSVDSGDEGFGTGDRITCAANGRFSLEGRLDHVVKIGEKRLDLARMESELLGHPMVDELALLTIDREGTKRVAAVVVPSEMGWELLRQEGRRVFSRKVRSRLAEAWDPVLHPRYWRMVRQLPEDSRGKLTRAALTQLFISSGFDHSLSDRPVVTEEFRDSEFLERACIVPGDLECFSGHFPGDPVVPGILQIDWALEMAADLLGRAVRVEIIDSLKFLGSLRPGDAFRINVRLSEGSKLYLRLWGEGSDFARGRIRLCVDRGSTGGAS